MEVRDDSVLEWEVRLGDSVPGKRMVVAAAALGAGLVGYAMFQNILVGMVGILAILISSAEIFLPISYRLDSKSARSRCGLSVTEIHWGDVKRLIPVKNGVRLSPLERESRLDAFRGVYLRFAGNEEAVLGKIREFGNNNEHELAGAPGEGEGDGSDRRDCGSDHEASS